MSEYIQGTQTKWLANGRDILENEWMRATQIMSDACDEVIELTRKGHRKGTILKLNEEISELSDIAYRAIDALWSPTKKITKHILLDKIRRRDEIVSEMRRISEQFCQDVFCEARKYWI